MHPKIGIQVDIEETLTEMMSLKILKEMTNSHQNIREWFFSPNGVCKHEQKSYFKKSFQTFVHFVPYPKL